MGADKLKLKLHFFFFFFLSFGRDKLLLCHYKITRNMLGV
jgi:hypothetical protein